MTRECIPCLSLGRVMSKIVLSFVRGDGNDVHLSFSFPGPHGPVYPLSSYPLIQELTTPMR